MQDTQNAEPYPSHLVVSMHGGLLLFWIILHGVLVVSCLMLGIGSNTFYTNEHMDAKLSSASAASTVLHLDLSNSAKTMLLTRREPVRMRCQEIIAYWLISSNSR